MAHAAVIGGGSWGTALARVLADKGEEVRLWCKREEDAEEIERTRTNARYLPGVSLPPSLRATANVRESLVGANIVVLVVPSHVLREVTKELVAVGIPDEAPIVSATKGIENESLMLMSEVLEDVIPPLQHRNLAYLSGPSFAREVVRGMATAIVIASRNEQMCHQLIHRFSSARLRAYANSDVVGVEMGGALKNVIAIAAGAVDGLGLGHNARAAVITRGLAEIARLAMVKGGSALTLAGLSGMGDLVLTCTGEASRNRTVGYELGRGRKLADVLGSMTQVAEGVRTTKSAKELGEKLGVELPITQEVYRVLYEDKPVAEAVNQLMTRALSWE